MFRKLRWSVILMILVLLLTKTAIVFSALHWRSLHQFRFVVGKISEVQCYLDTSGMTNPKFTFSIKQAGSRVYRTLPDAPKVTEVITTHSKPAVYRVTGTVSYTPLLNDQSGLLRCAMVGEKPITVLINIYAASPKKPNIRVSPPGIQREGSAFDLTCYSNDTLDNGKTRAYETYIVFERNGSAIEDVCSTCNKRECNYTSMGVEKSYFSATMRLLMQRQWVTYTNLTVENTDTVNNTLDVRCLTYIECGNPCGGRLLSRGDVYHITVLPESYYRLSTSTTIIATTTAASTRNSELLSTSPAYNQTNDSLSTSPAYNQTNDSLSTSSTYIQTTESLTMSSEYVHTSESLSTSLTSIHSSKNGTNASNPIDQFKDVATSIHSSRNGTSASNPIAQFKEVADPDRGRVGSTLNTLVTAFASLGTLIVLALIAVALWMLRRREEKPELAEQIPAPTAEGLTPGPSPESLVPSNGVLDALTPVIPTSTKSLPGQESSSSSSSSS